MGTIKIAFASAVVVCLLSAVCFNRFYYRSWAIAHSHPRTTRMVLPLCNLAQVDNIVHAHIVSWKAPEVIHLPPYSSDAPFSRATIEVDQAIKGSLSGQLEILVYLGINQDGSSEEGPLLLADGGPSSGILFLHHIGSEYTLVTSGYLSDAFDADAGAGFSNSYYGFVTDRSLFASIANAGVGSACSDVNISRYR